MHSAALHAFNINIKTRAVLQGNVLSSEKRKKKKKTVPEKKACFGILLTIILATSPRGFHEECRHCSNACLHLSFVV